MTLVKFFIILIVRFLINFFISVSDGTFLLEVIRELIEISLAVLGTL